MYSPLFGVSNAYFLTQPPPLKTILENSSKCEETKSSFSSNPSSPAVPEQLIKDLPTLLSQVSQVRPRGQLLIKGLGRNFELKCTTGISQIFFP
jgi:hypothetical protein